MPRVPAADEATALTTRDLRETGLTKRQIAEAVGRGDLIRLRLGRYAPAHTADELVEAARWGGRLDCISLLAARGVFVHTRTGTHIQVDPHATRLPPRPASVRCHWRPTAVPPASLVVDVREALAQAVICQPPRHAIATIDSAWHLGLVDRQDLDAIFARLPAAFAVLRDLSDPRSESGTETLVRLLLRTLGHRPELQVRIDGVGRVDLLVDGWLIIECDSREFHAEWAAQVRDRRRDAAALARGYVTLRLVAADVLSRPDVVRAQLEQVLGHGPAVPRSGASRLVRRDRSDSGSVLPG
ncbi:type IV toxin-antitoxin system AbiEi family antitoxin domain-containing protein [Microbacterium sp. HMWF026]|uniref:type IV toxin-antitoxin system AbiEi family antitoxin domain-containing protein n=1 Tax=Microbacterium sp. HMWF026 TaxID=2056861 RepID=UPI0015E7E799|nr:type IV toxin-antitoxin system AbiEi family antitoxin domain-containing protein [Microbacterium sp. HMWF026]